MLNEYIINSLEQENEQLRSKIAQLQKIADAAEATLMHPDYDSGVQKELRAALEAHASEENSNA